MAWKFTRFNVHLDSVDIPEKYNAAMAELEQFARAYTALGVSGINIVDYGYDASSGVWPASPSVGDAYVIAVAGTIDGVRLGIGTLIFWAGDAWYYKRGGPDQETDTDSDVQFKSAALTEPMAVESGGTGADNVEHARENLGAQAQSEALDELAELSSIANLLALAGLAGAANRSILFTGDGAMSLMTVTPQARNLLDDTSAGAMRTTLGATTVGANLFTAADPGAIGYFRVNANNTVTFRTPAQVKEDLGLARGVELVSEVVVSGSPVIFEIAPTDDLLKIELLNVYPATDGGAITLAASADGGATWHTNWRSTTGVSGSEVTIASPVYSSAEPSFNFGVTGEIVLSKFGAASGASGAGLHWRTAFQSAATTFTAGQGGNGSTVKGLNRVRLSAAGGFAGGIIRLYRYT